MQTSAQEYAGLAREPAFCPRWKPTIKNPNIKTFDSSQILVHLSREEQQKQQADQNKPTSDSKANETKTAQVKETKQHVKD